MLKKKQNQTQNCDVEREENSQWSQEKKQGEGISCIITKQQQLNLQEIRIQGGKKELKSLQNPPKIPTTKCTTSPI